MENSNATSNKELVRKYYEYFEQKNYTEAKKLLSDSFMLNINVTPKPLNRDEAIEILKTFNTAFPDLRFTFKQQFTDGDYVISQIVSNGTHKGDFRCIPPTGRKATINVIAIQRIVNNKIVEATSQLDTLGLLQQIGVVPTTLAELAEHEAHYR